MLKQLLKYEFKATCGYYGSAYLVLLASALLLGLGATHMPQAEMETVWAIMALVYMGTILAIIVLTVQQIDPALYGKPAGTGRLPDAHFAGKPCPADPFQAAVQRRVGHLQPLRGCAVGGGADAGFSAGVYFPHGRAVLAAGGGPGGLPGGDRICGLRCWRGYF